MRKLLDRILYGMHVISGVVLVSMMLVTLSDVIVREVFSLSGGKIDFTFIGGVELIKYGLLIMALFALPYSVGRSQVIVDLFTENFSSRLKAVLEGIYMLGFVLLGSGMCYRFYHSIWAAQESGETTQDLLIPLSYIYAIATFATGMLAIAALAISLRLFFYWRGERIS